MHSLLQKLRQSKVLPLIIFMTGFAIVGTVMLFRSFALNNSTISGTAFKDLNRNQVQDVGEEPWQSHHIAIYNSAGAFVAHTYTDTDGKYTFNGLSDGTYKVAYSSSIWSVLRQEWAPTTTQSLQPEETLTLAGSASFDFGWRPISWSADPRAPKAEQTFNDGLRVQIFNDAVEPAIVRDMLLAGSLRGQEISTTTIQVGLSDTTACPAGIQSSNNVYTSFSATCHISWNAWLDSPDYSLFHEYGHAWSLYHDYIVQQDGTFIGYLKARGLSGDPRVGTSYKWSPGEMIAEDYRQLFGSPAGQAVAQANKEIPPVRDVPGLEDYLRNVFTKPPLVSLTAPTNFVGSATLSTEGPAVNLSWAASQGSVDHYDVYRNGTKIGFANAPTTKYYDISSLSYSTSYSYYVKAVDADGKQSPTSNTINVTTPAPDTQRPTAPTSVRVVGATTSSISLQWLPSTDNTGIVGYNVYREQRRLRPLLLKTATTTSVDISGLNSGTSYSFYITAVDAAGNESPPSSTVSAKTKR